MRLLAAVIIAASASFAAPANAQAGWGMSDPAGGHVGELSRLSPTHRYWAACRGEEAQSAAHACGRVIGARVSRTHTASAHYFRSIALATLGDNDQALRDLRRAYGLFSLVLDADQDDANALYGRGLTLIRMGYAADGQVEIDRAIALSEGQAGRFFDASYEQ